MKLDEPIAGAPAMPPETVADLIIWMDQEGIDKQDKLSLLTSAGILGDTIAQAEEIVIERYNTVTMRHHLGRRGQRHGRKW